MENERQQRMTAVFVSYAILSEPICCGRFRLFFFGVADTKISSSSSGSGCCSSCSSSSTSSSCSSARIRSRPRLPFSLPCNNQDMRCENENDQAEHRIENAEKENGFGRDHPDIRCNS